MSDKVRTVQEVAKDLVATQGNILALQTEISLRVAEFQNQLTKAQEQDVALRAAMVTALEATGDPKTYEDENIKVIYIKPSKRLGLDMDKIKLEMPEIIAKYAKYSNVRSQVRITVK